MTSVKTGVINISKKEETAVEGIVESIITEAGFEYVGTEVNNIEGAKELVIYADKKGGITLDECEKISRLIEPAIDASDPIKGAYFLCVSSPGLDRPLKSRKDFERSIGRKVDVKLYGSRNGGKDFTGFLKGSDGEGFTIVFDGSEERFLYKDVAIVRLHVDI